VCKELTKRRNVTCAPEKEEKRFSTIRYISRRKRLFQLHARSISTLKKASPHLQLSRRIQRKDRREAEGITQNAKKKG
jgi:hypothetical protein